MVAFIPVILQVLMLILKWVVDFFGTKSQQKEFFPIWLELARSLNLKGIVKRYDKAEEQLAKNNSKWDEIEEKERELEKTLEGKKT